jgi:hypothetical protein
VCEIVKHASLLPESINVFSTGDRRGKWKNDKEIKKVVHCCRKNNMYMDNSFSREMGREESLCLPPPPPSFEQPTAHLLISVTSGAMLFLFCYNKLEGLTFEKHFQPRLIFL